MIITALRAENVLKYSRLELAGLPTEGVIAISGPNESGKSTIGETLCFALFGRTFSLAGDDLGRLIRWGAAHCSVTLEFQAADQSYQLTRYYDTDGKHTARLQRVGETQPIATGVEAVARELFNLTGFEFEEFIDSFYLAQREITKPHPHSYTVKTMAGIAAVQYVQLELANEDKTDQTVIDAEQNELRKIHAEIEGLAVVPERLGQMEQQQRQWQTSHQRGVELAEQLEQAGNDYQEAQPLIRRCGRAQESSITLQLLALAVAAVAAAGWWLLSGQSGSGALYDFIKTFFSDWAPYSQHLYYTAIGAAGVFGLFLLRYWISRLRVRLMQRRGRLLAQRLDELAAHARGLDLGQLALAYRSSGVVDEEVPEGFDEASLVQLRSQVEGMQNAADPAGTGVKRLHDWLLAANHTQQLALHRIARHLEDEQLRRKRLAELESCIPGFQRVVATMQQRMQLRAEARELLTAAGLYMSKRFNQSLRDLAGRTLPLFTEGRYQHMQIDDALNVRVFSSDKRDYLDLEEISSGTQRQIMLAVRLALGQQLVDTAALGRQFAFLDEPFAFFDQERTRGSLAVLGELSDDLRQMWVVAQEFPSGVSFQREIHCSRNMDNLISTG